MMWPALWIAAGGGSLMLSGAAVRGVWDVRAEAGWSWTWWLTLGAPVSTWLGSVYLIVWSVAVLLGGVTP